MKGNKNVILQLLGNQAIPFVLIRPGKWGFDVTALLGLRFCGPIHVMRTSARAAFCPVGNLRKAAKR